MAYFSQLSHPRGKIYIHRIILRLRINNQIDCELRIDDMREEKRRKNQRQGIEASRQAGRQYGRPKATITADWDDTYKQWKSGDITADDAARKLGISKATLYRRTRYKN